MTPRAWLCEAHQVWTTGDCPKCDDELVSLAENQDGRRGVSEKATYGMCLDCGSVEVALVEVTGYRDLSDIGEHPRYPVGYGCEVCA